MDYKTVFINLCLELQQNWSWIKGLGKNPFTHSIPFTHSLTAVPFVRGHRSVCHSHEWRVDTASSLTLKKQNACLHAVRHAVGKKIACIHGLRSEGVNTRSVLPRLVWLVARTRVRLESHFWWLGLESWLTMTRTRTRPFGLGLGTRARCLWLGLDGKMPDIHYLRNSVVNNANSFFLNW